MKNSNFPEGVFPPNLLICPNCRGQLTFSDESSSYRCITCKTGFPIENGVVRLLPTNLEIQKSSQDKTWSDDKYEGVKEPPWLALLIKKKWVLYFLDKILPKYRFEGLVLEIGAGSCWASGLVKSKYPDTQVVATDVSPAALQKGIEVVRLLNSSVNYYIACDVERLPFASELFDYVFGGSIIHHLLDPPRGVSEISRVLKDKGVYIGFREPSCNKILGRFLHSRFSARTPKEEDVSMYSFGEWMKLFHSCGFKPVHVNLETDWRYAWDAHWLFPLYYKAISAMPSPIIKSFLFSSVIITGRRNRRDSF